MQTNLNKQGIKRHAADSIRVISDGLAVLSILRNPIWAASSTSFSRELIAGPTVVRSGPEEARISNTRWR
jgi:hypothetical protein